MPKRKIKKFFRPVHFQALLVLVIYFILSRAIFLKFVSLGFRWEAFVGPFVFGSIESLIFLYLFSHEDFFHFMKDVEKAEEKKEEKYLKQFGYHGRILTAIFVSSVGGPIFLALTVRLLMKNFEYKYWVIIFSVFVSTIIDVLLALGVFHILI